MNTDSQTLHNLWWFAATMSAAFALCLLALLTCIAALLHAHRDRKRSLSESLDRSRSVLRGQVAEVFAPLLPGFPFQHKDARFLGQPIDYLVFNGLSEGDGNQPVEIVLVEIKTGNSALSQREAAIRQAVREGRIRWLTLRMDDQGRLAEDRSRSL